MTAERTMDLQEQLKDIKTQFRLAMNGAVSKSMRDKGLDYKLNFGIELPRLKQIASRYPKNHQLAQALWKENIRESKILAGMLQPVESFIPELADIWMEDMRYPEIAELTCMNLFQYLPYVSQKVFEWIADDRPYFQACGYLALARLFSKGMILNERAENEYFDQVTTALQSSASFPQRTAYTSLLKYVGIGKECGKKALKSLSVLKNSGNPEWKSLYENIKLETEENG